MVIGQYSIGGYWCRLYYKLLLVIMCYIITIDSYYIIVYVKLFFIGYYFIF
jgi:hypothetical protein